MDAVKFIEARQRLCKARTCETCELSRQWVECGSFDMITDPEKLVAIVEEWSKMDSVIKAQL